MVTDKFVRDVLYKNKNQKKGRALLWEISRAQTMKKIS